MRSSNFVVRDVRPGQVDEVISKITSEVRKELQAESLCYSGKNIFGCLQILETWPMGHYTIKTGTMNRKRLGGIMISMSIRNAKMNFSQILALVERGEEIVIRNRQRPVAKISSFKEDGGTKDFSAFLDGLSKLRVTQKPAPRGRLEKGIREDRDRRG